MTKINLLDMYVKAYQKGAVSMLVRDGEYSWLIEFYKEEPTHDEDIRPTILDTKTSLSAAKAAANSEYKTWKIIQTDNGDVRMQPQS